LKALRYPFVVVVGCLLIAPTLMTILISFTSGTILFFPPPGYGTRWYANFFERPEWVSGALTSLQVGLVVMAVSTVLGTLTALAIQRGRFPGRDLLIALVLSPIIAPSVIVGLGMYVLYLRLHLVGSLLVFVAAHSALGLPFVVVNVTAGLRTVDRNVERAALNLGATPLQTFIRITLPLILPAMLAGALFAFITSWDEVVIALFLSTPLVQTLPVVMWTGIRFGVDPTVAAASAMSTAVSLLIGAAFLASRWVFAGFRRSGAIGDEAAR